VIDAQIEARLLEAQIVLVDLEDVALVLQVAVHEVDGGSEASDLFVGLFESALEKLLGPLDHVDLFEKLYFDLVVALQIDQNLNRFNFAPSPDRSRCVPRAR
jgi:hypothetical protein